jgi:hypothetical protein
MLTSQDSERTIRVFDMATGDMRVIRSDQVGLAATLFTADSRRVVAGGADLRFYSAEASALTPRDPDKLRAWLEAVTTARIDADGQPVTTASPP